MGAIPAAAKYHENLIKELAVERAELAARAAATEAASGIREQERHAQLKIMCTISERGLEEKYSETLTKMRE